MYEYFQYDWYHQYYVGDIPTTVSGDLSQNLNGPTVTVPLNNNNNNHDLNYFGDDLVNLNLFYDDLRYYMIYLRVFYVSVFEANKSLKLKKKCFPK